MNKKITLSVLTLALSFMTNNLQAQVSGSEPTLMKCLPYEPNRISDEPFRSVEQMPQFPGGDVALMKFVDENLKYPAKALELKVGGRVVVQFVVTKEGIIDNAKIVRSLDPSCDKEALRIVNSMPTWIPGKLNGVEVNVYYTLPIIFKMPKETEDKETN